jgi:hypothetical protein
MPVLSAMIAPPAAKGTAPIMIRSLQSADHRNDDRNTDRHTYQPLEAKPIIPKPIMRKT